MKLNNLVSEPRFLVALSFPGEKRDFVEPIAQYLSNKVGKERVFYDKYYEAELARPNLNIYLQEIYQNHSALVVPFFDKDYERKPWCCNVEWRAILGALNFSNKPDNFLMVIRFDQTPIPGFLSQHGFIQARNRKPEEIANLILQRLDINENNLANANNSSPEVLHDNKNRFENKQTIQIELTLDRKFDKFSSNEQDKILQAISNLLEVEDSELHITGARKGSVIVSIQLSKSLANKLQKLYTDGKLSHLDVIGMHQIPSDTTLDVASNLNARANELFYKGEYDLAEPLYTQSLNIIKNIHGNNHPAVAESLNNLALLYKYQSQYNKAEALFKQSINIFSNTLDGTHPDLATSLNNLASVYRTQERYDEAEPLYTQSLELLKTRLGNDHPLVAKSLNNIALLYKVQSRYNEAEELYRKSLEILVNVKGEIHPDVATALNNLAQLYLASERYDEAGNLYLESAKKFLETLSISHPRTRTVIDNLHNYNKIREAINKTEIHKVPGGLELKISR